MIIRKLLRVFKRRPSAKKILKSICLCSKLPNDRFCLATRALVALYKKDELVYERYLDELKEMKYGK